MQRTQLSPHVLEPIVRWWLEEHILMPVQIVSVREQKPGVCLNTVPWGEPPLGSYTWKRSPGGFTNTRSTQWMIRNELFRLYGVEVEFCGENVSAGSALSIRILPFPESGFDLIKEMTEKGRMA